MCVEYAQDSWNVIHSNKCNKTHEYVVSIKI